MTATVQSRRVSAVVGALVADAAAQPLHWIYDKDKVDAMVKGRDDIAFWEPSANPFYTLPCGTLSGYGDQSLTILQSLVQNNGLDPDKLKNATFDCFGPKSVYENNTNAGYKEKSDAKQVKKYPIQGPWRHFSIKHFLKSMTEGNPNTGAESDEQMDCTLRVVSIVALYAGRPDMLDKAEEVIRQTQNSDTCVAVGLAAARLLEYYILNGPMDDAVEHLIAELSNQKRANPQDLDKALASFLRDVLRRKGDPHIQVARSAVHGVITGKDYKTGVETTFRAGGCNASRGGFIGACLAAQYGLSSIPESWKQKTLRYTEILDLANKLVQIPLE